MEYYHYDFEKLFVKYVEQKNVEKCDFTFAKLSEMFVLNNTLDFRS